MEVNLLALEAIAMKVLSLGKCGMIFDRQYVVWNGWMLVEQADTTVLLRQDKTDVATIYPKSRLHGIFMDRPYTEGAVVH